MPKKTIESGIPGLDELLGGGIPEGKVLLVIGGPGSGKTTLCTQFLINGITANNDSGLMVSLDENKQTLYGEMETFGWSLSELEKQGRLSFVDASPSGQLHKKNGIGRKEFSLQSLLEIILSNAKAIKAKRIVVDPLTSFIFQYPDAVVRRNVFVDVVEALRDTGATSILTTELRTSGLGRAVQVEEYLAEGVVLLQVLQQGRTFVRSIQVEKMRGAAIDLQPRPYKITPSGIAVFPRETVL